MLQWLRDWLRRIWDIIMPGPPHTPPGHNDEDILAALQLLLEAVQMTNTILRQTEENNQQRHKETLAAIEKDPVTVSMVWVKKRREKIP